MIRTEKDLRSGMNLILCLFRVCLSKKEERFQSLRLVGKARVSRKQGAPRESSGFQFPFCSVLQWCLRKPKYKVRMKKVFLELVGVCREDLQGPREPCQAPDRGQGPFLPACGFATALPRLFFGVVLILFRYRLDE